jgi:hypothetical protein
MEMEMKMKMEREMEMEIKNTLIKRIFSLKEQRDFEEKCLLKALELIPKKYADIVLNKYSELCCEANNG